MATAQQYRHEDVATVPRGWRVRTKAHRSGAQVRIAYPPGAHKEGSGRLISILHPNKRGNHPAGLHLSICQDPDFAKELNPKAITYLQAAEEAAKSGSYGKTSKLLRKYVSKKKKELEPAPEVRSQNAKHRKNQTGAAQLYTDFHGRAPSEILTMQEALMTSGDYTALGDMGSLWLEPVKGEPSQWPVPAIEFEKKDKVKLATDAQGQQLYLVGGNQKLPLDYLEKHGVAVEKRFISLGEVYGISYLTTKSFDGFRESEYAHEFGEKTGERPSAFYDAELQRIVLAGGAYSIADLDDALGASPGIVN